ncbi:MarR family winged helix-turn-helix transcriptional regulator [Marinobacter sp. BSs20148]|jgi:DNA-binding MarR family transcriptional regulator|uniref:MarR family winged helix-turn-helix transcriptional regulator n=1 Tax=Marinobacter sp. BSs20148 TaxID=490759 RepID=UPI0009FCC46A|nr:MarR family transcriptional regulator [Marinobacter sp. BSs20148]
MSNISSHNSPYIGAMLRVIWQWVREQIFAGVVAAGYDDLNPAHVGLFRYPTLDGQRPTELADQLQIKKQSINDLLRHLEQSGYLVRKIDPADRRARIVRLTARGQRLEKIINDQAKEAENQIAEMLGNKRFMRLRSELEVLVTQLPPR